MEIVHLLQVSTGYYPKLPLGFWEEFPDKILPPKVESGPSREMQEAMQTQVIIETILKHVDNTNLVKLRLVSKQWNSVSLRVLEKRKWMPLVSIDELCNQKAIGFMTRMQKEFYRKRHSDSRKDVLNFFQDVGEQIATLELYWKLNSPKNTKWFHERCLIEGVTGLEDSPFFSLEIATVAYATSKNNLYKARHFLDQKTARHLGGFEAGNSEIQNLTYFEVLELTNQLISHCKHLKSLKLHFIGTFPKIAKINSRLQRLIIHVQHARRKDGNYYMAKTNDLLRKVPKLSELYLEVGGPFNQEPIRYLTEFHLVFSLIPYLRIFMNEASWLFDSSNLRDIMSTAPLTKLQKLSITKMASAPWVMLWRLLPLAYNILPSVTNLEIDFDYLDSHAQGISFDLLKLHFSLLRYVTFYVGGRVMKTEPLVMGYPSDKARNLAKKTVWVTSMYPTTIKVVRVKFDFDIKLVEFLEFMHCLADTFDECFDRLPTFELMISTKRISLRNNRDDGFFPDEYIYICPSLYGTCIVHWLDACIFRISQAAGLRKLYLEGFEIKNKIRTRIRKMIQRLKLHVSIVKPIPY